MGSPDSLDDLQCPLPTKARCLIGILTGGSFQSATIYRPQLVQRVGGVSFGYERNPDDKECLEQLQDWLRSRGVTILEGKAFAVMDKVEQGDVEHGDIEHGVGG